MARDRILLEKIPALTFYAGEETVARRSDPIPQLTCIGRPCKIYQPEVIRCTNIGGTGTEVEWKCEADLPEALRFGRVEVSCEGYSRPGDPYVLKGSCGLQYKLVQVPGTLRNEDESWTDQWDSLSGSTDILTILFNIVWFGLLIWILYGIISSCFRGRQAGAGAQRPGGNPGGGGGGPGGWFPHFDDAPDPNRFDTPPPYSKYPSSASGITQQPAGAPGWGSFLTGAAVGGLASQLWNRRGQEQRVREWDWERERVQVPRAGGLFGAPSRGSAYGSRRSGGGGLFGGGGYGGGRRFDADDRGEGSSTGAMRSSMGLGGSSVR
ncbi:hypothetical protein EV715DRAFT_285491 [Schizophyllum commune]